MGTITVSKLGKAYKQYPSRWGRLAEWVLPGSKPRHNLKWVLQDVSFSVSPGEAVGIIGINGAGKSTLLKMITGTTQPTTGSVHITGRVAAMLELGMGFHPDFTGRQNAFMAGQLLGYSAEEIARLMPEIEAFAQIGDYIDQPVRVYSSGMQMRLAFSVATAHRPDVLIVDEALSVGDAYFQHKSFDRIREFRKQGTTLMIVSHDKAAIQSICDRAILLDSGCVAKQGSPEEVMDCYNAMLAERENAQIAQMKTEAGKMQTISGTGEARVEEIVLLNKLDEPIEVVNVGEFVTLRVAVRANADIPRLVLGYMIKDRLGQPIFGTNTHHTHQALESIALGDGIIFRISFSMDFGPGSYSIATSLHSTDTHLVNNYEWKDLALIFTVLNQDKDVFIGTSWVPPSIEIGRAHLVTLEAE
jgi:lipopolysaccharide transport system ATP-binding protein